MLYIRSLEIENVRCFGKKQMIDFARSDGNIAQWSVILGDNGTGKTTLLRSIVSMLPAPQSFLGRRSHLDTEYNLSINNEWRNAWNLKHKEGEKGSKISLVVQECETPFSNIDSIEVPLEYSKAHTTEFDSDEASITSNYNTKLLSPVFCFAYGANRKVGPKFLSGEKLLEASETLFNEEALLQNSEEYFLQLDYETAKSRKGSSEIDKVKELLIRILPTGVKDIRVVKRGRLQRTVQVETSFGWVAINELSLGYKTTIAWLIDFATKMIYYHEKSENPFNQPAILVLDEIDLHMHPAWQREIIEKLTELFPKTQFIVTAHSPLIAQAALDSNLILLKRNRDHVTVINEPEIIRSWRVDQVLTSDLFGLKDARPKDIERKMNRRIVLLKKDVLTDIQQQELNRLNREVYDMPIGETKPEIDAMEILKDFAKKIEAAKNR